MMLDASQKDVINEMLHDVKYTRKITQAPIYVEQLDENVKSYLAFVGF